MVWSKKRAEGGGVQLWHCISSPQVTHVALQMGRKAQGLARGSCWSGGVSFFFFGSLKEDRAGKRARSYARLCGSVISTGAGRNS